MNDLVERILNSYQSMRPRPLDPERVADSRQKISRYLESLASAGQRDADTRERRESDAELCGASRRFYLRCS